MSADYQAVQWNRFKLYYDLFILIGLLVYIGTFLSVNFWFHRPPQDFSLMISLIRATGSCAFIIFHIILIIGPLARLSPVFKPLLYNRRHLGVSMFLIATSHIVLSLVWYHSFGVLKPLISLFISNPNITDFYRFPFELYGFFAYLIIMIMALTSHDFWLRFFSAPVWKILHMGGYIAYGLLVFHVLFGFIQSEGNPTYMLVLLGSSALVFSVHLIAAFKEFIADKRSHSQEEWVPVCPANDIENNKARGFMVNRGDKVAVFRYETNRIIAVANACAHQNGPLCEGRIIKGLIVCPWHGYEYCPTTGQSPPPFTEKISTYNVRIQEGTVYVRQQPNPAGTPIKPAIVHKAFLRKEKSKRKK